MKAKAVAEICNGCKNEVESYVLNQQARAQERGLKILQELSLFIKESMKPDSAVIQAVQEDKA